MAAKKNTGELSDLAKRFFFAIEEVMGYSGYRLAEEVKILSQSTLTHIRTGRNEPTTKVLIALLEKFPTLDGHWLLTGEGQPEKKIESSSELETLSYTNILHKIPVEEIFTYFQKYETERGLEHNEVFKMFMEIRVQRKVIEKLAEIEVEFGAKYDELRRNKGKDSRDKS